MDATYDSGPANAGINSTATLESLTNSQTIGEDTMRSTFENFSIHPRMPRARNRTLLASSALVLAACAARTATTTVSTEGALAASDHTIQTFGVATWQSEKIAAASGSVTGFGIHGETLAKFQLQPGSLDGEEVEVQSTLPERGFQVRSSTGEVLRNEMSTTAANLFDAYIADAARLPSAPEPSITAPGSSVEGTAQAFSFPFQCPLINIPSIGHPVNICGPQDGPPTQSNACKTDCMSDANYVECQDHFIAICHRFSDCSNGDFMICDGGGTFCGLGCP